MIDKYLTQDYKNNSKFLGNSEKVSLTKKELTEEDHLMFSQDPENFMSVLKDDDNDIKAKLSQESLDAFKANEIQELNDPTLESEENQMKNYINIENQYMNEGKSAKRIKSLSPDREEKFANNLGSNENINQEHNSLCSLASDTYLDKNEFKLKRLQEIIEEKLKKEYDEKIRVKEKEIKQNAKYEFEETINMYKSQFQLSLEEDKKKVEDEIKQKWEENYDNLLIDCKNKLREDKEQKLVQKMYQKLKPEIEREIYKNEYGIIAEKIKFEIEDKLSKDIYTQKIKEIDHVKKKMEYYTKVKLEEMEKHIKDKCKEEMEMEIKKEIEKKEKEFKNNYLKKFEVIKGNLEKQLKEEYVAKQNELAKELSEMKSKVNRQKIEENVKMNKLNNLRKNLIEKEKSHLGRAEKLNTVLNSLTKSGMSSKSFSRRKNASVKKMKLNQLDNNECKFEVNNNEMNKSNNGNSEGLILQQPLANKNLCKITEEEDHQASKEKNSNVQINSPVSLSYSQNNSVNLQELNKKFRSPVNTNGPSEKEKDIRDIREISEKEINVSSNPLLFSRDKEKKESQIPKSPSAHEAYMLDSPTRLKEESNIDKQTKDMSHANIPCLSLQIEENVSSSFFEFGKYLVKHIEKEENCRILFEKEQKKLKLQLKNLFDSYNFTDHCLTDYMMELWEKIDISYSNRYRILNKLAKSKATECYSFLDKETEYLTDYFQKTQGIFQMIKTRERLKVKLQEKANRNELLQEDKQKFNFITKEVEKMVRNFTEKSGAGIIWKGVKYDWLMNYENWFYENKK